MHEISFANALLYSRAVPMPGDTDDNADAPLYDDRMDANMPDNYEDFDDEIDVTKL